MATVALSRKQRAFTLIELMIAVAIVGILSAIAYPSYMDYVRKSNRVDARTKLLETSQILARCFTQYGSYTNAACSIDDDDEIDSDEELYKIVVDIPSATTFTLRAAPVVGKTQAADTKCATLTLAHTGAKGATGTATGECW